MATFSSMKQSRAGQDGKEACASCEVSSHLFMRKGIEDNAEFLMKIKAVESQVVDLGRK